MNDRPSNEEIARKREERRLQKRIARDEKERQRVRSIPEGVEFHEFPKIARFQREIVITEKIDGTNAAVGITGEGVVYAQSRKRIITPEDDNFGFARWVSENADGLRDELGPGLHFGEWWGAGIQRRYGLDEKRFSLFNAMRWKDAELRLCRVVPIIVINSFLSSPAVESALRILRTEGSRAAPGFMNPEGVVIHHRASNTLFKRTFEDDDCGKSADPQCSGPGYAHGPHGDCTGYATDRT